MPKRTRKWIIFPNIGRRKAKISPFFLLEKGNSLSPPARSKKTNFFFFNEKKTYAKAKRHQSTILFLGLNKFHLLDRKTKLIGYTQEQHMAHSLNFSKLAKSKK